MPVFEFYDPEEFRTEAMLRHECAHLLLAYHYGFRISRFRFIWTGQEWGGAVRNEVNPDFQAADPANAEAAKARQLLVGEIAARRFAGLPEDRVVLSIGGIHAHTPLHAVASSDPRVLRQDSYRVVDIARGLGHLNWWPWFWARHAEARAMLTDEWWAYIEQLAGRLRPAKPYETNSEIWSGRLHNLLWHIPVVGKSVWRRGTGRVEGGDLVAYCHKLGIPVRDPAYQPVSYISVD